MVRGRKPLIALMAILAIPIYFWAVAVIERQGFRPDHPDAVEKDQQPLLERTEKEKPPTKPEPQDSDAWPRQERWFQDPLLLALVTLTLAGFAFLMHLRQRRKARRLAGGS